ncbi:DUF488 family protein [bacterium]|nr:MAG: DUF488 family protein [bacterium]
MVIKTKSVYGIKSKDDGLRVLVTRYWPRGVKKQAVSVWLRGLGPKPELIKLWKDEKIKWVEFKKRYLAEFVGDEKKMFFSELESIVQVEGGQVTLLCACKEDVNCHRSLLKEMLEKKKYQ